LLVGCASAGPGEKPIGTLDAKPSEQPSAEAGPEPAPALVVTACAIDLPAQPVQLGRLELPVSIEVAGVPLELATPARDAAGNVYDVSFFAFYIGNVHLIDAAGAFHKATLLDAQGAPRLYDLLLVNADKPETQQLRLAAAPRSYSGVRFDVGVPQPCNALEHSQKVWPLTVESEMDWGWTALQLRLEGRMGNSYYMYHLGFPEEYRSVQVMGALTVQAQSTGPTLVLAVDRLLDGASASMAAPVADNLVTKAFALR